MPERPVASISPVAGPCSMARILAWIETFIYVAWLRLAHRIRKYARFSPMLVTRKIMHMASNFRRTSAAYRYSKVITTFGTGLTMQLVDAWPLFRLGPRALR